MVTSCLATCNGREVEHYIKQNQGNESNVNDLETSDVLDELENIVRYKWS